MSHGSPATPLHTPVGAPASRPGRGRVVVLDLLRLLAAVQMVQGHTIDAVLAQSARAGEVHAAWLWLRGTTSVAFLFAAGLSFHLATLGDLAGHRRNREAVKHRFRRAGTLIALGYALHLPLAAMARSDPQAAAAALRLFFAVDVLQCIGATLIALECLALVLRSRRAVEWAAGLLGASVLLLASRLAVLDPHGTFLPLLNYVSPRAGSIFPLFPWAAHMLLGVWLWGLVLAGEAQVARWTLAAALAHACALCADWLDATLVHTHLARLGWVLVAGAALVSAERVTRSWPTWVWRVSGSTLFIYAFHVLLVYGQGVGLASLVGPTLPPVAAIAVALLVMALSFGLALVYVRVETLLAGRARKG